MNKKKAIKILEIQKSKLEDKNLYKDEIWVFQTASYIKDFFGENSTEYIFISQFQFGVKVLNTTENDEVLRLLNEKKDKAAKFIDNCIETINKKGLLKNDKMNFLNRLGNEAIITILVVLISSLITVGFYFGTEKINKDNINLTTVNKRLTSTFDSLNSIIKSQSDKLEMLQMEKDSVNNDLLNAKSEIAAYQETHKKIQIKYSEPYSLFGGLVLINAEKYFDKVKFSFVGNVNVGLRTNMSYQTKNIEIEQGKRFFVKDHLNQLWIVNVLKVDSFEVKIELVKKTMP